MENLYDKFTDIVLRNHYTLMMFLVVLTFVIMLFFFHSSIYGSKKGTISDLAKAFVISLGCGAGTIYAFNNKTKINDVCDYDNL